MKSPSDEPKPYGYFVWMKNLKGPPSPKKFIAELDTVYAATAKYYEDRTLEPRYPLTEAQFKSEELTLDELAKMFPPPAV
jgi:hypothetical protein